MAFHEIMAALFVSCFSFGPWETLFFSSCLHYLSYTSSFYQLLLSLTCCCVSGVIERLGMSVVPYVVLLVVPVLGRMSDQCEDVRLMATYCFATLIRLMPLEVSTLSFPFIQLTLPLRKTLQILHIHCMSQVNLVFRIGMISTYCRLISSNLG